MLRRLYFLFPDESHAQLTVSQLMVRKIPLKRIHAISRGVELNTLPQATERQKNDTAYQIEQFLWKANLLVFAVALITFIASLVAGVWLWSVLSVATMVITFFGGKQFVEQIPHDHLTEFTSALAHGEILLMVDVPIYRVAEIARFVEKHHPETTTDGVSWSIDAFGI